MVTLAECSHSQVYPSRRLVLADPLRGLQGFNRLPILAGLDIGAGQLAQKKITIWIYSQRPLQLVHSLGELPGRDQYPFGVIERGVVVRRIELERAAECPP